MELLSSIAVAIALTVPGRTSATPSVAADGRFLVVAWSAADASGTTDTIHLMRPDGTGVVDLGTMGGAFAKHLVAAGWRVLGSSR